MISFHGAICMLTRGSGHNRLMINGAYLCISRRLPRAKQSNSYTQSMPLCMQMSLAPRPLERQWRLVQLVAQHRPRRDRERRQTSAVPLASIELVI